MMLAPPGAWKGEDEIATFVLCAWLSRPTRDWIGVARVLPSTSDSPLFLITVLAKLFQWEKMFGHLCKNLTVAAVEVTKVPTLVVVIVVEVKTVVVFCCRCCHLMMIDNFLLHVDILKSCKVESFDLRVNNYAERYTFKGCMQAPRCLYIYSTNNLYGTPQNHTVTWWLLTSSTALLTSLRRPSFGPA